MAETTQFVSRISVKDLITAFENKSETVRVEFSRPRARSFGNVLNKNVIVRLNEFTTLDDIEKGLTKLETNLNFYEVYNKAKHVAFQEQFFNILTSIANIENEDEDTPTRKRRLISRTQTLVSFLNQKLPSNINQVIGEKPKTKNSYTKSTKNELNSTDSKESKSSNGTGGETALYVESNGVADVTDSGGSYFVSVKKLKETFQQKKDEQTPLPAKQETILPKVTQNVAEVPKLQNPQPKEETKRILEQPVKEDFSKKEEKLDAVSVTKLRSLFEQRSEESPKGLEIITIDKSQLTKNILGRSAQDISIPFTERNLGTFRLQRSVSGNYMNYSGLLKRIDINRSNSSFEVTKESTPIVSEDLSNENSDDDSENTLENQESVVIEEVKEVDSPAILENGEEGVTFTSKTEFVSTFKKANNVQITYSSQLEQEENNNSIEHTLSNGKPILAENKVDLRSNSETVAHRQDSREEKRSHLSSTASLEGYSSSSELSFQSADETEVNLGTPVTENVPVEETIAKFEALSLGATSIEGDINNEYESSFKPDEIEVNSGIAESKTVEVDEDVTTLEVTDETGEPKNNVKETNNHVTNDEDELVSSTFSSLLDLDEEKIRAIVEEETRDVDVEQILKNADLNVNPDDIKNADDEFERLMESY